MMQKSELARRLLRKCEIALQRQTLMQQKQELDARLPQAKYVKREADTALLSYESGGVTAWLDKLSGKWQDKCDTLRRSAAAAESDLRNLRMELERTDNALAELASQEQMLDIRMDIKEAAKELPAHEREAVLQAAARICALRILAELKGAAEALDKALEWARPNNLIDVAPGYTKEIKLSEAEARARECSACMRELEGYGITMKLHPYFQNPSGYIHGVAAQFAELDRINGALKGIHETEKQVQELMLQLTEEEEG